MIDRAGPDPRSGAWLGLSALWAVGSLCAWPVPTATLDWQPGEVLSQPWRAWTAAFVHWSALHLGANLLGVVVLAALGWVARVPAWATWAWVAAWPFTHWGLGLRPELAHFGGLSGVLHAGVAVVAVWLVAGETGYRRAIGLAIAFGLIAKILLEAPWGPTLRQGGGWDIAVAPLAHATGAAAGALGGGLARLWCEPPWRRQSGA